MAHNFSQCCSKWHFHYLWLTIGHVIVDSQHLGTTCRLGANTVKRLDSIAHNYGHIGQGLNAVNSGWLIPQAVLRRIGRALFRHAAPAFNEGNLHGFLSAHEADVHSQHVDITTKIGTQNITSNQVGIDSLTQRLLYHSYPFAIEAA